ncbi:hypothetical protein B0H14DRAFT_2625378 [Mycena olivaceomarginata]|nr:hypothetical protein B0H14DRAFT_2625378 [Mycena olivaceomarginata]
MKKLPLVQSWRHSTAHLTSLYRILLKVQSKIRVRRQVDRDAKNEASRQKRAATKRMKRKAAELSDAMEEEAEDSEEDEEIEDFPAPNELRGRATRSRTPAQTRSKSLDLPTEPSLDAAAPNKRPRRAPARVDDARELDKDFSSTLPLATASDGAPDTTDSYASTRPRAALETVTNAKRTRRAPEPLKSVASTMGEYGRNYKPRNRGG